MIGTLIKLFTDDFYERRREVNKISSNPVLCGDSEQFVCLCPRNEVDNCDRNDPCKECETCTHLRQTNCT
jgi:hypothetical protein